MKAPVDISRGEESEVSMKEKSAVILARSCSCGTVQFSFDMDVLLHEKNLRPTLLEMADILDQVCEVYRESQKEKSQQKPDLKVVN